MIIVPDFVNDHKKMSHMINTAKPEKIRDWALHNTVAYHLLHSMSTLSPEICFIYLYNDMMEEFNLLLDIAIRKNNKEYVYSIIVRMSVQAKLSPTKWKELWQERAVDLNMRLLMAADLSSVEMVEFFLTSNKFWKQLNNFQARDLEGMNRLENEAWYNNDKFAQWALNKYQNGGYLEKFIPQDIKEMFLF